MTDMILYGDGEHDDTDAMDAVICREQKAWCESSQSWVDGAAAIIQWPEGVFKRNRPLRVEGRHFTTVSGGMWTTVVLPWDVEHLIFLRNCHKVTVSNWIFAADRPEGFERNFDDIEGTHTFNQGYKQ